MLWLPLRWCWGVFSRLFGRQTKNRHSTCLHFTHSHTNQHFLSSRRHFQLHLILKTRRCWWVTAAVFLLFNELLCASSCFCVSSLGRMARRIINVLVLNSQQEKKKCWSFTFEDKHARGYRKWSSVGELCVYSSVSTGRNRQNPRTWIFIEFLSGIKTYF